MWIVLTPIKSQSNLIVVAMLMLPCAQVITQDRTGHKDPVRGALYNAVFSVIVSVDEASTTCLWNLQVRPALRNLRHHEFQELEIGGVQLQ